MCTPSEYSEYPVGAQTRVPRVITQYTPCEDSEYRLSSEPSEPSRRVRPQRTAFESAERPVWTA